MKIRNVGDLKTYLPERGLSPEGFAKDCTVSNMTIRRMLGKQEDTLIPKKYWAAFDRTTQAAETVSDLSAQDFIIEDFRELARKLEEDGKTRTDFEKIDEEIQNKNKSRHVGKKLKELVKTLLHAIKSNSVSKKDRFLAIGALVYFLNPVDLIPDTIPAVGYLDDYAVLTMVAARMVQVKKSKAS